MGSSALLDAQSSWGDAAQRKVLTVGAFGLGREITESVSLNTMSESYPSSFIWSVEDASYMGVPGSQSITSIVIARGGRPTRIHQIYTLGRTFFSYRTPTGWLYQEAYTTGNTTKASDGTLKAASPVARIVASADTCLRSDIAEDGFSWCGCGTANTEAEGIKISRVDVGVYVLTGSAGLASEGWQLLPPMDPGGMGELGVAEAEQTADGELTIRLFKRKYMLSDEGEIVKTKGEPMDVPVNSWIDVRLDMPDDSVFNQRMRQEPQLEPLSPAL